MAKKRLADLTNARSIPLYLGIAMILGALGLQASGWPHWITIGSIYGVGASALAFFWYLHNEPKPNLKITAAVPATIHNDGRKWYYQHDGANGFVIWVINARKGSETPPATGVVAMLQFHGSDGQPRGYIQRAYWMDTPENYTDISVGIIKHLVLGTFQDGHWCVYNNEQDIPPLPESPGPPWVIFPVSPSPRIFSRRIPIEKGLRVTVSVSEIAGPNFTEKTFSIDNNGQVAEFIDDKKEQV